MMRFQTIFGSGYAGLEYGPSPSPVPRGEGVGVAGFVQPKCLAQAMIQLVATAFHGGQK
jgi:hypothetical protein